MPALQFYSHKTYSATLLHLCQHPSSGQLSPETGADPIVISDTQQLKKGEWLVSQQDCPNLYVLNPRAIPCPSLFPLSPYKIAGSCPQLGWNPTALLCCRFQQSPSRWETWGQATPPPLLPTELCSHMTQIATQTHLPQYPPSRQPSLSTLVNPYRHKYHPQLEEQKPL